MNHRDRATLVAKQNSCCAWCAHTVTAQWVQVVERPAGPIGLCGTCLDRYERPNLHGYVRRCLKAQGR